MLYIIFPCITWFICSNYNKFNKIYKELNVLFSGRLSLSNTAIQRYPIKLLGQYIEMNGNSYGLYSSNYFYIDSGFLYSILGYGLIFTIIVIFMYSYLFKYACQNNNKVLFIWLTAILVFTVINNTWISLNYNPILLSFMSIYDFKKNKYLQKKNSGY